MTWKTWVVCLGVAALFLALWLGRPEQSTEDQQSLEVPHGHTPSAETASAGEEDAPREIEPVPLTAAQRIRVQIVDSLSRVPLENIAVSRVRGNVKEPIGTTDATGDFHVDGALLQKPGMWSANLPASLGGGTREVDPRKDIERSPYGPLLCLDVFAMIHVLYPTLEPRDATEIRLRAFSVPPIPYDRIAKQTQLAGLEMNRSQFPETYVNVLQDLAITDGLHEGTVRRRGDHGTTIEVLIPYQGDVALISHLKGFVPSIERVVSRIGVKSTIAVHMRRRPTVAGLVLLDGAPVPHVDVRVTCVSHFEENESMSRDGGSAMAVWRKNHETGSYGLARMTTTSDQEGRFEVSMPFTDRVQCCVFLPDGTGGIESRSVKDRYVAVEGLVIKLSRLPASERPRMRLVDEAGDPVAHARLTIRKRGAVFQTPYPDVRTSESGWFDIGLMDLGKGYTMWVDGTDVVRFVAKDLGEVTLHEQ